jgi:hypothetical protein
MGQYVIDDPMLALIARFAGCCDDLETSEEAFLRDQCDRVREYVESYPGDQRQQRALEWITRNAEDYRRRWQQQLVSEQALVSRCPDCPLESGGDASTCEIHDRWLDLLNQYLNGETSSAEYVAETLRLLGLYKRRLRKSVRRVANA